MLQTENALEALLAPEFLLGRSRGQAFWWEGKPDALFCIANMLISLALHVY